MRETHQTQKDTYCVTPHTRTTQNGHLPGDEADQGLPGAGNTGRRSHSLTGTESPAGVMGTVETVVKAEQHCDCN